GLTSFITGKGVTRRVRVVVRITLRKRRPNKRHHFNLKHLEECLYMKPIVKEFKDDTAVMEEVKGVSEKGVSEGNLYVMSHDDDRTDRAADQVAASKAGMKEEGLATYCSNIFNKQGEELRSQLKELRFS